MERSRHLYAQAAQGPEYAYPACGEMITRAPGIGILPMPGISSGTFASHSSSCAVSVGPEDEYHEPAWSASLTVMMKMEYGDEKKQEKGKRKQ